MILVDKNLCSQNHRCPAIKVCPVKAISQNNYELPQIDQDKCIKCEKCIKFCPMGAIQNR